MSAGSLALAGAGDRFAREAVSAWARRACPGPEPVTVSPTALPSDLSGFGSSTAATGSWRHSSSSSSFRRRAGLSPAARCSCAAIGCAAAAGGAGGVTAVLARPVAGSSPRSASSAASSRRRRLAGAALHAADVAAGRSLAGLGHRRVGGIGGSGHRSGLLGSALGAIAASFSPVPPARCRTSARRRLGSARRRDDGGRGDCAACRHGGCAAVPGAHRASRPGRRRRAGRARAAAAAVVARAAGEPPALGAARSAHVHFDSMWVTLTGALQPAVHFRGVRIDNAPWADRKPPVRRARLGDGGVLLAERARAAGR